MTPRQQQIVKNVDKYRQDILDAERWIWQHPEVGYTEWQTNAYLLEKFRSYGYEPVEAGDIPGFYADVDTGRPGPCLAIMGELDALDIANHPESVNGMTHCCGHNCQCAEMVGIAAALKEPGALDGLCGKIRLMLVPAEEMIQLEFRKGLIDEGKIKYLGGKPEFMRRGYFDGVDLSLMVHTDNNNDYDFTCQDGFNGIIAKILTYKGRSSHAGGSPEDGINAQYAATLGLDGCNALREMFRDEDHIRFHPILKGVKSAVNIIPDEMRIESYTRGKGLDAYVSANRKLNRALAAGAVAMGAQLHICEMPGYATEYHDHMFMNLCQKCCEDLSGKEKVKFDHNAWSKGSSDFGDLTMVMPGVQFYANGHTGLGHGIDFCVADPERACVNPAKAELFIADALLSDGAAKAKEILAQYEPPFASIREYLDFIDTLYMDKDVITYTEKGIEIEL
ncbi:MAG: hypothetical protein IKG76_00095, partial [Firmicutes bacterium]|nr:hypothetical protein [Bacillota bacterium]